MGTADGVEPGAVDRAALQLIAEGVTELAGFELAAISIVHDGRLHTIAIAGDDHAPRSCRRCTHGAAVLAELENAEDWGLLRFVPHERETARAGRATPTSRTSRRSTRRTPGTRATSWSRCSRTTPASCAASSRSTYPATACAPTPSSAASSSSTRARPGRAVITLLERHEFEHGMRRERATSDYRGQLIDALSHQLQNPVAAITGNLELLFDDLEPGRPDRAAAARRSSGPPAGSRR